MNDSNSQQINVCYNKQILHNLQNVLFYRAECLLENRSRYPVKYGETFSINTSLQEGDISLQRGESAEMQYRNNIKKHGVRDCTCSKKFNTTKLDHV